MDNHFLMNEDILWDYVDGLLSNDDRHKVEAYILQHPEWKHRAEALLQEKRALFAIPMERPDRGFADRVMAAWTAEQVHQTSLATSAQKTDWILYAIAGTFSLFIIAPVVLMIITAMQSAPIEVPAVNIPTLSVGDWSRIFDHPVFQVGLAAAFALLLVVALEKYLHQKQITATLKI